ncbi:hypothetical protein CIW83_09410 [Tissierella sp. P1]|uniref:hypothetical protein n=1 Tax=Tissierella sp. P1 TaxID=1280483 RepID=UPI000BA0243E|nr:hypothetical protein [Tissierella sp. P1]OZV12306.1 hypothetical protein CIW83_09410 [Tissierella sp. P1]
MIYEERLDLLIESIRDSKLNGEEFVMLHGILDLSKDRNTFNKQYNTKIDEIIKKKGSVENV